MASVRAWRSSWQVRWRDPNGKQRTKSFKRKADATKFANRVEVEIDQGSYVDPQLGKALFGPWAEEWLQSKINLRASSWARDESYLRNHVQPEFENVPLSRIDKLRVQGWVRSLVEKGLHAATIYHCYRIFRGVMEEAVDARLIVETPCRRITLPRIPKTEQRFLSATEVEQLADAVDAHYRALIYSAAYLGCRWGELVGLKWSHVDLDKREVRIVGTLEETGAGIRYVQETKTSGSRRSISIPSFLVELLKEQRQKNPAAEFVFMTKGGRFISRNNFRSRFWKPALRAAGIEDGLRFHDLRHTCASLLIEQGAHPKEIQARLGHSSITTTLDRYGHLMPALGHQLSANLDVAREQARSNVEQMWNKDDADVIEFPYEIEGNDDLPAKTSGGRYWVRTSDLCRVKAALYR